jgi:uncharacterized repeat protein (TIGR03803 family)
VGRQDRKGTSPRELYFPGEPGPSAIVGNVYTPVLESHLTAPRADKGQPWRFLCIARKPCPRSPFPLLVALFAVLIFTGSAMAQHEQAYPFTSSGANGANPQGGLVVDAQGNFYGTTFSGGSAKAGVVYEMSRTPDGKAAETVLYNFTGNGSNEDGANPNGDLIFDGAGNLYGVTFAGGPANKGTVFELSPPSQPGGTWTETVLYGFTGDSDGGNPPAGLVFDQEANLYGTAAGGGKTCLQGLRCGTVFELSPPSQPGGAWSETLLYSFSGLDGGVPMAPVVFDQIGNLFGTTYWGGLYNQGAAFELSPPVVQGDAWTETVIHSFEGSRGRNPQAGVVFGPSGALFGTTMGGGTGGEGTVFRLAPPSDPGEPWMWTAIHNFSVFDGSGPLAGLIFGAPNTLYGTTGGGGDEGTVFKVVEKVLYSFSGFSDGRRPQAGAVLYKGSLYGTTSIGGYASKGVVFKLSR